MTTFSISDDTVATGFHDHVRINPLKPIAPQLNRKKLVHRNNAESGNPLKIQKIIEDNSSLRVDFGWSFESPDMYETIMDECIDRIVPKYNVSMVNMITDLRCSWLGFLPFNIFTKSAYEDLSIYGMIIFNNEVSSFQEEVVQYISSHKLFRQHSITRDEDYRFDYFKSIRDNEDALEQSYWDYINAIKETIQIPQIPRDIVEKDLGCHYLNHPTLFFELLAISKLKGELI